MSTSFKNPKSVVSRFLLRLIFIYIILYIFPYGLEYIQELNPNDISFWEPITIWFGETFLGWEYNEQRLLKGFDSKYDFARFLLIGCLALLSALIWTILDVLFKLDYNDKLKVLFRTILRYHVGLTLIIYGLSKVFMLQFGVMDLDKLEGTTGNHSGMSYLWNFMSYSEIYTRVSGWLELIAGFLLLFRKTSFLGAFMGFVIMANVVLMDIGYDVKVKMFAIHLFFMTILLLGEDIGRIIKFFTSHKIIEPKQNQPLFSRGPKRVLGYIIKGSILTYFIISCFNIYPGRISRQNDNRFAFMTEFHTVDIFIKNGDTLNSLDDRRWKSISINGTSQWPETFSVVSMNKKFQRFSFEVDTLKKELRFKPVRSEDMNEYLFKYQNGDDQTATFKGLYLGDTLEIQTRYKTFKDYRLTRSRFKWITDLK